LVNQIRSKVLETTKQWSEPHHPPREEATAQTLEADNRFTEESIAYAINHFASTVTEDSVEKWTDGFPSASPDDRRWIGVVNGGQTPSDGFRDLVAVLLSGGRYVGTRPDASPHLLSAFVDDLKSRVDDLLASFAPADVLVERADGIIAEVGDESEEENVRSLCNEAGVPESRRLIRPASFSVAILDGNESEDEREDLAEDMLLHQGFGRRRAAVVWIPEGMSPDPYFQAMAQFRAVFPAHDDTPGALQMQQAFLEARDAPHAYAAGLEFLVSRGAPEPQSPGHVRWSEYDALDDVAEWTSSTDAPLYAVVAREQLHARLSDAVPEGIPLLPPGRVHRPTLSDAEGETLRAFLANVVKQA